MSETGKVIGGIIALAFVALLTGIAWRSQRVLELGLPPKDDTAANQGEAWNRAALFTNQHGGDIVGVLGTGSMAPYIPAGDPHAVVAYVVTKPFAKFADVTPGAVCIYRHTASPVGSTMHGAARLTPHGWIMSGLHNPVSDAWMTERTFVGLVAKTFTWRE